MKQFMPRLVLAGLLVWVLPTQAGELLGHISEESAPAVAEPANPTANDRRIIYRVICSPEGEALPDCEKPFHDSEAVAQPKQREDGAEEPMAAEQAQSVAETTRPTKTKKSKKIVSRKKTAGKKAKKTSSSKKRPL